jgi:hypothetical protein
MSQYPPDPNYNPYNQNPFDPNYNQGTTYGGPSSEPGQNPNPYNPYPNTNPPAPDTNPSSYGPYGQNQPTPAPPPYNPYAQTATNTNPNYNQYATMPPPPTIPPTQSRRGPSMRVILIAGIALALVLGGIAYGLVSYNNNTQQSNANATATAQANIKATAQANASATARAAQVALTATAIASTYPFSTNLKLSDPLSDNTKGSGWQTDNLCKFQGNAYHATDTQASSFTACSAINTNFTNFTFEVEAVLNSGDAIGITFRGNADKSQFYRLAIYTDGSYAVYLYVDSTGTNSRKLTNGNITPTPDLTNTNVISVVARGSTMVIYFNKTEVTTFTDPTYTSGQIGVAVTDLTNKADGVFTNLNVWALP